MPDCDVILRGGRIYDGGGGAPFAGDVAIAGDAIAAVGDLRHGHGHREIQVDGLAVAPGFINMLSWATVSLIADGRSQSDIRQGVTLEVMGEGESMGPLNEEMKRQLREEQVDVRYEVEWTTLGEYLDYLERRGISTNVASFMGATTARIHVLGHDDRRPTEAELEEMRRLVRQAMEEGAVGLSSALIYPPACFSDTDELIALARVVAECDGLYISHIRSENESVLEALQEFFTILRRSGVRGEIYHLKVAGRRNWDKMDAVLKTIEAAQAEGLQVSADMYTYPASATGLTIAFPHWVHEGGHQAMIGRLTDPATRQRVKAEMTMHPAEDILLVAFNQERLRPLVGRRLAEVAAQRGTSPEDTLIDLVIEDDSRVGAVYFSMSEENVRKIVARPWVSFGSDGASMAVDGVFSTWHPHPRGFGNFARLLAKYVREEAIVPLAEAIRRLTWFPATNLRLDRRGRLLPGFYADVVVFDPAAIQDHATFEQPRQYATGVRYVFVNGVPVVEEGEHTGALPGRAVRGPGWKGRKE